MNADWLSELKSKLNWSTLKSTTSMLRDEVTAFFWVPRGGSHNKFSTSVSGQKRKGSDRAQDFRFTPESRR